MQTASSTPRHRGGVALRRSALTALMALCAINLWTGAPLLGLWVGSRLVPASGLSMAAVGAVVVVLAVTCWALVRLLALLGEVHDRVAGRAPARRRQSPWLKPMSGERAHGPGTTQAPLTALDRVLVVAVVACVLAFEAWFFFFSGSPIG